MILERDVGLASSLYIETDWAQFVWIWATEEDIISSKVWEVQHDICQNKGQWDITLIYKRAIKMPI